MLDFGHILCTQDDTQAHMDDDIRTLHSTYRQSLSRVQRVLVLCLDGLGIGDDRGLRESNVLEFFRTLDKGHSDQQVAYYQPRLLEPDG